MCFAGLSVMVRQVNTICCCAVGCHTHTNCHLHDQSVYTTGTVQPIILFFFFIIIVQYMCVSFMRWASVGFSEQIFYVSLPCSSAAGHSNSNMSRPMTVSSPFTLQNGLNIAYQNYHLLGTVLSFTDQILTDIYTLFRFQSKTNETTLYICC